MALYYRSTIVVAVAVAVVVFVAATVVGLAGLTVTEQKNGAVAKNTFFPSLFHVCPLYCPC